MKIKTILLKVIFSVSVLSVFFFCARIAAQENISEDEKKAVAMQMAEQAVKSVTNMFGDEIKVGQEKLTLGKKKDDKAAMKKEADPRYSRKSCYQTDSGEVQCYEWSAAAGDGDMWVSADESAHTDSHR